MNITMPEAIVSAALVLGASLVAFAGVVMNHLDAWLKKEDKHD